MWLVLVLCFCPVVNGFFDYELYHNLTAESLQGAEVTTKNAADRTKVEKLAMHGFGRVLTWNVKKLGACLRQDNVEQLKEVVCVILQSANVIVLQETENLDLSCLPCNTVLKDEYEWPAENPNNDFKIMIRTKHSHSFKVNKAGKCESAQLGNKKSDLDNPDSLYQTAMRKLQFSVEQQRQQQQLGGYRTVTTKAVDGPNTYIGSDASDVHSTYEDFATDEKSQRINQPLAAVKAPDSPALKKSQHLSFHEKNKELRINVRFHVVNNSSGNMVNNSSLSQLTSSSEPSQESIANSVASETQIFDKNENQQDLTRDHTNRFLLTPALHSETSDPSKDDTVNNRFVSDTTDTNTTQHAERFRTKEIDTDNVTSAEEDLQTRLLKDKEMLNNTTINEQKSERFRLITDQLKNIEKEIVMLHGANDNFENRFYRNESGKNTSAAVESGVMKSDVSKWKTRLTLPTLTEEKNDRFHANDVLITEMNPAKLDNARSSESTYSEASETSPQRNVEEGTPLADIDLDSDKMHHLVNEVLLQPKLRTFNEEFKNDQLLEELLTHRRLHYMQNKSSEARYKRTLKVLHLKRRKKGVMGKTKRRSHRLGKRVKAVNASKRGNVVEPTNELNYVITTVTSDLNSGEPFLVANVKLPRDKRFQRHCMEKIMADVSNTNSEAEKKLPVFIMGDFHFDHLTGADDTGDIYKILNNLQIDGDNYHAPIIYSEKDPITTVYGRRFDNILTNMNLKGNLKTIGPDLPVEPEPIILPLTLQRLYNNYMTALYSSDGGESDSIYECIKAFQLAGKSELNNVVCKDSWVPSSFISDHLPLQVKVKIKVPGKSSPIEINIASWNIQGDTFKERLMDPAVKKQFFSYLKNFNMAVFQEFPGHDRILDDDELGTSDIVRLKQGDITTDFGMYVSEYSKDGEADMFVLRKKFKDEETVTLDDNSHVITTVGLFAPKLVIDTVKIRPCLYTVKTSENDVSTGVGFAKIMNAIQKDVATRKCDFKVLLGSMNLEENFDLDKEIYKNYKYINMKCKMTDGKNKYTYNIPRSRDLADYVIILDRDKDVEFDECTIGLPGDEPKRGIDKLSDFEELSTHYPFSIVVKKPEI
ncbi:uncharacterized protein LOC130649515 isoform X1 [Hydractinia symbiolongicarpus]|uniref:uncharacterized protein LOC130649515 isoform X1 n=1 Tax=Hydractinia symbiolongicarpus TaxID=13093 RepID=UPI00254A3840|nr:uncharacterized protein LOC130649515 isoform X1 [Hydractinia symbiolongicarpus]XP_057311785.1 uncharacterized protein LOC130649515 isoform X1 [Hydractinia symbiolongicarpus]